MFNRIIALFYTGYTLYISKDYIPLDMFCVEYNKALEYIKKHIV